MEEVRHGFNSGLRISTEDRGQQPPFTLSPTAFPGRTAVTTTNTDQPVKAKPMFPDMRQDEFMSKSTISTKDTALAGDYWSVSSASEQQEPAFRSPQQPRNYESGRRQHYERDGYESRDYDPRGRRDGSIERRPRPVEQPRRDLRSQSKGRPRERYDLDEPEGPPTRGQYDNDYNDRYDPRYRRERKPQFDEDYRRPQHMREEDDYVATIAPRTPRGLPQHLQREDDDYTAPASRTSRAPYDPYEHDREPIVRDYHDPPRRERFPPRSPRAAGVRTPRAAVDDDIEPDYRRRGKSPIRSDYGGSYTATDDHEEYARLSSWGDRPGRSKSREPWKAARPSDERGGSRSHHHEEGWDEEVSHRERRRSPSRERSTSRERGGRRDYEPYEPVSKARDPRLSSRYGDDLTGRERPRLRTRGSDYDDEDGSDATYQFEALDSRRGRRTQRYDDDESSASSVVVERGASKHLDISYGQRGRSRSIERKPQRRRSKSREKLTVKEPSEFVIDISQPTSENEFDGRGVTFSPSTEIPRATSEAGSSRMSEDHSQRIADANLMKEQSEARHQILKEVRQAMEMRDIATTVEDREFWSRQVNTLNTSLRKLWENYDPSSDTPTRPDTGRNLASHSPAASVNNYTTVKVQAPDNLPAGHQFTIRVNGKPLKAQVPGGGVRKGDVFTIRIPLNAPPTTPARVSTSSMVKIRAPAALPEGYRFTAKMGDRTIVATVPPGGVQKGEIFAVPVSDHV